MRIAIGCDKLAVELKQHLINAFTQKGHQFVDMGVKPGEDIDYPEIGEKVAAEVAAGGCERGILICGTGIGMAISANKVPGIRAAVCHDIYSTERSILSNNAHILCLGALVVGHATATALVDKWLSLAFIEGPSSGKISKISKIERKYKAQDKVLG
ncbi:MAG: RpiB/LacA/LacB family sugar-phosphate isomerase [Planctomycetaceae bacterium]|nr:RpiB/LacA/LacB family sugar-phosphate isomerase [Planctomycetaceae bacterium]